MRYCRAVLGTVVTHSRFLGPRSYHHIPKLSRFAVVETPHVTESVPGPATTRTLVGIGLACAAVAIIANTANIAVRNRFMVFSRKAQSCAPHRLYAITHKTAPVYHRANPWPHKHAVGYVRALSTGLRHRELGYASGPTTRGSVLKSLGGELPSGLEALHDALLIGRHQEEPTTAETLHAHAADSQERGGAVRLPRFGLAVHRG